MADVPVNVGIRSSGAEPSLHRVMGPAASPDIHTFVGSLGCRDQRAVWLDRAPADCHFRQKMRADSLGPIWGSRL